MDGQMYIHIHMTDGWMHGLFERYIKIILIKSFEFFFLVLADFSDWRGVGQNVARDISKGTAGTFNATRNPF